MPIPHFRYSFAPGFQKMTLEDARKAQQEIFDFLGCTAKSDFSRRKHNFRDVPHHIYNGICKIFDKYGVQEQDVWMITELKL